MNFIQEVNKTNRLAFVQMNRSIDKRFRFAIICEIFELKLILNESVIIKVRMEIAE